MDTDFARQQMVEQQVRAWDVLQPEVLDVLREVPREQFVPEAYEALAFADTEIPIGHGQAMMTPTLEGRVLQALQVTKADEVLEIGTGTGFLCACLAGLASRVTSVDVYEDFVDAAKTKLDELGLDNATLTAMDATEELPDDEFDVIAVTGSVETFDSRFVTALKPGGRLFIVVGEVPAMDARLVTRTGDNSWDTVSLFETSLLPLVNGSLPPQFLF